MVQTGESETNIREKESKNDSSAVLFAAHARGILINKVRSFNYTRLFQKAFSHKYTRTYKNNVQVYHKTRFGIDARKYFKIICLKNNLILWSKILMCVNEYVPNFG